MSLASLAFLWGPALLPTTAPTALTDGAVARRPALRGWQLRDGSSWTQRRQDAASTGAGATSGLGHWIAGAAALGCASAVQRHRRCNCAADAGIRWSQCRCRSIGGAAFPRRATGPGEGSETSKASEAVEAIGEIVLDVRGLVAESSDEERRPILRGVDLTIRAGEAHAVMGPNGSGKSTLARVLIGDPAYHVTSGTATFLGQPLFHMEPHERALAGLFLAFQSPPAVAGVSGLDFLRAAYNGQRRARGDTEAELDVIEFYSLASAKARALRMDAEVLARDVNMGFSGGERKRNEMLQMAILGPQLAILDEIDSGLDVDALADVGSTVTQLQASEPSAAFLLITHFERFLRHVSADHIHVMQHGRIVVSGGKELAERLDNEGYAWIDDSFKTK
eukprot:NODE_9874_length_1393_cov_7.209321.p1 GENE.NODE_9874_length_1393_cov_7.209321~~NODE_9874_length_1393_cov_7.209321.p1  ORF type:complete len:393 (-),score=59.84 NODE_9874_length_1393_cov_7.209321:135-1313(-)